MQKQTNKQTRLYTTGIFFLCRSRDGNRIELGEQKEEGRYVRGEQGRRVAVDGGEETGEESEGNGDEGGCYINPLMFYLELRAVSHPIIQSLAALFLPRGKASFE